MEKKVVGIIRDESGRLEDLIERAPSEFSYKNELGEIVVYSFFQDFDTISASDTLFVPMFESITNKFLPKGINVKGFIFTKTSVVVIEIDDSTAHIVHWPSAENIETISLSTVTEDDPDGDED